MGVKEIHQERPPERIEEPIVCAPIPHHVACAPQDSDVLLTDFAAAYPSLNHSWIFSVLEKTGLLGVFFAASCEPFTGTALLTWNLREQNGVKS